MIVFYSKDINDNDGRLNAEDARHCYKVLRKKVGDTISVLDGVGHLYHCRITDISRNDVSFEVNSSDFSEREEWYPTISISLLKNTSRLEWCLEKLTEIGIRSVQPMICERTLKDKFRVDRAESIIISATKQSLNPYLPELSQVTSYRAIIENTPSAQKYICHYSDDNPHLYDVIIPDEPCHIMIGPEGDFTDQEMELAKSQGYQSVNISNNRLRTETAGITAAQIVALKNRSTPKS